MEGIFIPMEFQELEGITNTESMVLAIYKYYTEKGNRHYCSLKNEDICKMVRLKDESGLRRIKKHLKELGLIRTDGGIRVYYLGITNNKEEKGSEYNHPQGVNTITKGVNIITEGVNIITQGSEYNHSRGGIYSLHNKEEKRKKEIKKEEKSEMTNFDLLISKLPSEYRTPEKIEYIKNNFLEEINESNFTEGGVLDMCLTRIKTILNQKYPVEYKVEKKEPVSNTIDLF